MHFFVGFFEVNLHKAHAMECHKGRKWWRCFIVRDDNSTGEVKVKEPKELIWFLFSTTQKENEKLPFLRLFAILILLPPSLAVN